MLPPRLMNAKETAAYLRRSYSWFRSRLPQLQQDGFPQRLPNLKLWDRAAIDAWLDKTGARRAQKIEDPIAGF